MSSNIQNFQRATTKTDRKDINKILEALQDLFAAPAEKEAVAERIPRIKEVVEISDSVTSETWTASILLEDGTSFLLTENDKKIRLEVGNGNN